MKSYLFRVLFILTAVFIQQLFIPVLGGVSMFITIVALTVLSYDSTHDELLAYSFLGGFLVGAMSGSEMLLHLLGHLIIGGTLLTLNAAHILPSKHRTRILLVALFVAFYTFLLIVPLELNYEWWIKQTGWNTLLTLISYVLLLPLFSRIINREQHTLFYG